MNSFAGKKLCCLLAMVASFSDYSSIAQAPGMPSFPELKDKWKQEGDNSIFSNSTAPGTLPLSDNIEMSGTRTSLWVKYAVDTARHLILEHTAVFPSFRLKPNDTHASLMYTFRSSDLPRFFIGDRPLSASVINGNFYPDADDKVTGIRQDGIMHILSRISADDAVFALKRDLFPSTDKPAVFQTFTFINNGSTVQNVTMEYLDKTIRTDPAQSEPVPHYVTVHTLNAGARSVPPGDSVQFSIVYYAASTPGKFPFDADNEKKARQNKLAAFAGGLRVETPDPILNAAFAFAKRRISESIFETKAGLMMCPGGLKYYAAIWANDEAEYANPFYAFTGDSIGIRSAVNTYGMFGKYMNEDYRPLPSSIIAEGDSTWAGAGDRGDAAMIAYGASRFALVHGNAETAGKLWPLISWCLEYCRRKKNPDGVIASDADELEGRFPAGKANLSTSALYYDALISAVALSRELKEDPLQTAIYQTEAKEMASAIERYFGADMEGFHTYRYYKENTLLRSWICIPLAMGLTERKQGTIDALFSPALFSPDGVLTQEGSATFWDRSTLYALRGIFAAGETDRGIAFLHYYSQRRLLGDHVPYPVEAWPEGNQRHLAGESALYCRVFTEGLFGIRPAGFRSFDCRPALPASWNSMALRQVEAFGSRFDLEIARPAAGKLTVTINRKFGKPLRYRIKEGDRIRIKLD